MVGIVSVRSFIFL